MLRLLVHSLNAVYFKSLPSFFLTSAPVYADCINRLKVHQGDNEDQLIFFTGFSLSSPWRRLCQYQACCDWPAWLKVASQLLSSSEDCDLNCTSKYHPLPMSNGSSKSVYSLIWKRSSRGPLGSGLNSSQLPEWPIVLDPDK
jgi:hypothetical protein